MLKLNDYDIKPGDIFLVIPKSKGLQTTLKQAAQSLTTSRSKHGHREVLSVFICTGMNEHGVICHNFQRQLSLPIHKLRQFLLKKSTGYLLELLSTECLADMNTAEIKKALTEGEPWMQSLAQQFSATQEKNDIENRVLEEVATDQDKITALIIRLLEASGRTKILQSVHNSSLLKFRIQDETKRQQFLEHCSAEVKVTEALQQQGKSRTRFWALFKSFFTSSKKDNQDAHIQKPKEGTYCARHVMEMLNMVDPNLVNRGRHVLPKSLEAGLREATKQNSVESPTPAVVEDDFDAMIEASEQRMQQNQPAFTMTILASSGKDLLKNFLSLLDQEIHRIQSKRFANLADKTKADKLTQLLSPYRKGDYLNYHPSIQVDMVIQIMASILPALQEKTGLWGSWVNATAYSKVRAFLRTQGIFDGDIREQIAKQSEQSVKPQQELPIVKTEQQTPSSSNQEVTIFSDWSFASWNPKKRDDLLTHMQGLLEAGQALYFWKNNELVQMDKFSLQNAMLCMDLDDILSEQLKPTTRSVLLEQASRLQLSTYQINHLDYQACQLISPDDKKLEAKLDCVAPLFATQIDVPHLNKKKLDILNIEIENAAGDEARLAELRPIQAQLSSAPNTRQYVYQGGIDTKAKVAQTMHVKPLFEPVAPRAVERPYSCYYRNEIYSNLTINNHESDTSNYFELTPSSNPIENLKECHYQFHSEGLANLLNQKQKQANNTQLFTGGKTIALEGNEWQPLPSLHPEEKLTDIAINELNSDQFEIKYSDVDHRYYIRLTAPEAPTQTLTMHFLLEMPDDYTLTPLSNTLHIMPHHQDIHNLLLKYFKYKRDDGRLSDSIGSSVHNAGEYLDKVRELGAGTCRLRAIAFKEEMSRLHPEIPVAIVVNSEHFFIEMKLDNKWQHFCLGGYRNVPTFLDTVHQSFETCTKKSTPTFFKPKPVDLVKSSDNSDENAEKKSTGFAA